MEDNIATTVAQPRFRTWLIGIFAGLAVMLAAVGIYGVMSYSVTQRTNEIGIRMALGAKASDIFRIVLSSTTLNVGAGIFAGILLSAIFGQFATKWVNESSRNPLILAGVTLLLIAAALLASFIPARRAAAVDPMVALRYK